MRACVHTCTSGAPLTRPLPPAPNPRQRGTGLSRLPWGQWRAAPGPDFQAAATRTCERGVRERLTTWRHACVHTPGKSHTLQGPRRCVYPQSLIVHAHVLATRHSRDAEGPFVFAGDQPPDKDSLAAQVGSTACGQGSRVGGFWDGAMSHTRHGRYVGQRSVMRCVQEAPQPGPPGPCTMCARGGQSDMQLRCQALVGGCTHLRRPSMMLE
jgi:hypothetical protein